MKIVPNLHMLTVSKKNGDLGLNLPSPLFDKEGSFLPSKKGGEEGF
jgi:hypothetical protein